MSSKLPWNAGARWFAAEFFVVVTGVIVALAVSAWAEDRSDAEREAVFMRQVVADLVETQGMVEERNRRARVTDSGVMRLLHGFRSQDRPSPDSLALLVNNVFSWGPPLRATVGTVDALVSSGNIALVRSDSLRLALVSYRDRMAQILEGSAADIMEYRRQGSPVHQRVDIAYGRELAAVSEGEAARGVVPVFVADVDAFFGDTEVYSALTILEILRRNESLRRSAISQDVDALRTAIGNYLPEAQVR